MADRTPLSGTESTMRTSLSREPSSLCIMSLSSATGSSSQSSYEYSERLCRSCLSPALVVDWAAGDRVCTSCGVVDEERLRDDRPEWREFNDADDLAKGLPSAARCGMVPVDETRYLGGLQPTTLSKHVFGGTTNGGKDVQRLQRLVATNRKTDMLMEKQNVRALKKAKVSHLARRKQVYSHEAMSDWSRHGNEDSVMPEHDQLLLQEEEDVERIRHALYSEKWSIDRAILLHGNGHEETSSSHHFHASLHEAETEREELLSRLDAPLRQASLDLYLAYSMLKEASNRLHLPERVLNEATVVLCRYATKRDGLGVRGVSNRVSSKHPTDQNHKSTTEEHMKEQLREHNKKKQMRSLGSALLYLTARKLGWARSVAEVCASFQLRGANENKTAIGDSIIKPKHCSRAMGEVRALFPDLARTSSAPMDTTSDGKVSSGVAISTDKFVDHATRKLELPPVAVASIRTLVAYYRKEQLESGLESGTKLSTLTASTALLVCLAGDVLQLLAKQSQSSAFKCSEVVRKQNHDWDAHDLEPQRKSRKLDSSASQRRGLMNELFGDDMESVDIDHASDEANRQDSVSQTFDVFSSPSEVTSQAEQDMEYQTRRVFDAWSEQMPWSRSISRIEQSCGVSKMVILNHYKSNIYPRRVALLELLRDCALPTSDTCETKRLADSTLPDTPLASVLLSNITVAVPLLKSKVKL